MRLLSLMLFISCNDASPNATATVGVIAPAVRVVQNETQPRWNLVERILMRRDGYLKALELQEFEHIFTREYFAQLRQRKAAVQQWAAEARPEVVFVGQHHLSSVQVNTPEQQARIARVQDWVFEQIAAHPDAALITFEQNGTDEQLTMEMFMGLVRQTSAKWRKARPELPEPTDADILAMYKMYPQAGVRAIQELPIPVFCGEEWPIEVQTAVLARHRTFPYELRGVVEQFHDDFTVLRSEIILIRTLEFLREHHGKKAVITQGAMHAKDMQAMANEYHTAMTVITPGKDIYE